MIDEPIGGYFGLELGEIEDFPFERAILLNSGRACFEYILKANKPKRVYLPKYTCVAMLEPLEKLGVPHSFYAVNQRLELTESVKLSADELIVYNNYFGIKDDYSRQMSDQYGSQLILDSSQALYFQPLKSGHTFYSPRKFLGLPDGGILYTDTLLNEDFPQDSSYEHCQHLLKRIDLGPEAGYEDYKKNELRLRDQPIKKMSPLTAAMLKSFGFEAARQKRNENFAYLHKHLAGTNEYSGNIGSPNGPMCYVYMTNNKTLRQKLIDNKIFVATYWPNIYKWCKPDEPEYKIAEAIIPLPIDQRYGQKEMERIMDVIRK